MPKENRVHIDDETNRKLDLYKKKHGVAKYMAVKFAVDYYFRKMGIDLDIAQSEQQNE